MTFPCRKMTHVMGILKHIGKLSRLIYYDLHIESLVPHPNKQGSVGCI